jgi:hypothetical protein
MTTVRPGPNNATADARAVGRINDARFHQANTSPNIVLVDGPLPYCNERGPALSLRFAAYRRASPHRLHAAFTPPPCRLGTIWFLSASPTLGPI